MPGSSHLRRLTRRLTRYGAGAVVAVLVAGACTSDGAAPSDTANTSDTAAAIPEPSTLLRVEAADWPTCLHPLTCDDDVARRLVLQHVLPVLFEVVADGSHRPSPVLAGPPTSIVDPSTGEQTITYGINPAARWHDGRPITSTDVLATWHARLRTSGVDVSGYDLITQVDDADPLVAVVTLAQPYADWRDLFGGHEGWLLQADAFGDDADLLGAFGAGLPFGAGPFELLAFDDREIVLGARTDHWDPSRIPALDQVRIDRATGTVPSPAADIWIPRTPPSPGPVGMVRHRAVTDRLLGIWFDQRSPVLADGRVRQAITRSVDRTDLAALVTTGTDASAGVDCLGWLPADAACADHLGSLPADRGVADALFRDAGWTRRLDAVRVRRRQPMAIEITYDDADPRAEVVAHALRFTLRALGIQVDQFAVPRARWLDGGRSESTGIGVFAAELGTTERATGLYACDVSVANVVGWCDDDLEPLLTSLESAVDDPARTAAAQPIGAAVAAEAIWLPIAQLSEAWFVADGVVAPATRPLGSGALGNLHEFTRTSS